MRTDCTRLSSILSSRFVTLEQKLRALLIIENAKQDLSRRDLLDALEKSEINTSAVPLGDVVLLRKDKTALTTAITGPGAPGGDLLAIPEIARAYAVSLEQPGSVVLSRSFVTEGVRRLALIVRIVREGKAEAAFVALIRPEDFLGAFSSIEIPKGFAIRLRESESPPETALLTIPPDGPVLETNLEIREIGLSRWEFDWSATRTYLDGPNTDTGLLISVGGLVAALLIAALLRRCSCATWKSHDSSKNAPPRSTPHSTTCAATKPRS